MSSPSVLDLIERTTIERASEEAGVAVERTRDLLAEVQHTLESVSDVILYLAYEVVEETPEAYYLLVEDDTWETIFEVSEIYGADEQSAVRGTHDKVLQNVDPDLEAVDHVSGLVFEKDRLHKLLDAGLSTLEAQYWILADEGRSQEEVAESLEISNSKAEDLEAAVAKKRDRVRRSLE